MDDTNTSFNEALKELESILAWLRSENCDVDTLAERTARAAVLLAECRRRLTRTEAELAAVLESMGTNNDDK